MAVTRFTGHAERLAIRNCSKQFRDDKRLIPATKFPDIGKEEEGLSKFCKWVGRA